jgi:hypothetical protein
MPNHFHFLIQVKGELDVFEFYMQLKKEKDEVDEKEPNLSKFVMQRFSNFFNAYAKAYNKKYERKGSLFIDYVRRKEIKDDTYFSRLVHYIHYTLFIMVFAKMLRNGSFLLLLLFCRKRKQDLKKKKLLNGLETMIRSFNFISFHLNGFLMKLKNWSLFNSDL